MPDAPAQHHSHPKAINGDHNRKKSKSKKAELFEPVKKTLDGNTNGNGKNAWTLLRGKVNCHRKEILCGDYSRALDIIASGGRDKVVRLWEYERVFMSQELKGFKSEVTIVKFIADFPLLFTSDQEGNAYIWVTKPHPDSDRLVATWSNTLGALSATQITAVDTHYNPKTGDFWLFLGDDIGEVKIQDLRVIIDRLDLKPIIPS